MAIKANWSPRREVSLADQAVSIWNCWRPGITATLTVQDAGTVVYSDSQVTDLHGNFNFTLSGLFTLQPGHVVTVTDGMTVKTHMITGVAVTDIDKAADQIHGLANPGARVLVRVGLFNMEVERWVVADAGGNWIADFSGAYDVTGITRIYVNEFDEDADSTFQRFGAPTAQNRGVAVTAADNNVWVASSALGTVTRLDNDGNVVKVIDTGREPTGVAVDAAGKVWATNMSSWNGRTATPARRTSWWMKPRP